MEHGAECVAVARVVVVGGWAVIVVEIVVPIGVVVVAGVLAVVVIIVVVVDMVVNVVVVIRSQVGYVLFQTPDTHPSVSTPLMTKSALHVNRTILPS